MAQVVSVSTSHSLLFNERLILVKFIVVFFNRKIRRRVSLHYAIRKHVDCCKKTSKFTVLYINQSIKIYIAPLQDTYSEALLTQAKRKRTVLRRWWNWEQAPFGRCLRLNQGERAESEE